MAFIDEVQIKLKAGKGGDGVVRWRQEKYKPLAGPSGGNGGKGGDIYASTIDDLGYLSYYRFKKEFDAQDGQGGGINSKEGKMVKTLYSDFLVERFLRINKQERFLNLQNLKKKSLS